MPLNTFALSLIEAYHLSPLVKHFVFEAALAETFNYLPGQFITLHLEHEGQSLKRSYSLANPPAGNNRLEFAAGFVEHGIASNLLFNLKPQEKITASGPFGRLILKDPDPKRYVLVATSTGVTPFRAMLPTLAQKLSANPELNVVILLGVRNLDEAIYHTEFTEFMTRFPNQVSFRLHLSRPDKALGTHQYQGYVQHAFTELNLQPDTDKVYLCGNPGMIDAAFELLKEHHFSAPQIIREKYISAPAAPIRSKR